MKILKPSVEILEQAQGLDGIYKHIEVAGRTCYKSQDKITPDSARGFIERLIKSGHRSVLEHGAVYLQMPLDEWMDDVRIAVCPGRTHVVTLDEANTAFVTTNYRVLVENGRLDLLKWMCKEPEPMHERRVTARFVCQIAISREFNRHRINSISEESTRYCNYSKDKFDNEINVCCPSWFDYDEVLRDNEEIAVNNKVVISKTHHDNPIHQWLRANYLAQDLYMRLIELGWKPQQARTVLPLDTATTLVHTAFVSDWKHFFELRCDGAAHPDARLLACELRNQMIEKGLMYGSD